MANTSLTLLMYIDIKHKRISRAVMAIKKPLYWLIALIFIATILSITIGQGFAYARPAEYLQNPSFTGGTRFLEIDILGEITRVEIHPEDKTILESVVTADPSGNVTLELDSGTKIICSGDEIPERLAVRLSEEIPPVPAGLAVVSPVYDFVAYTSGAVSRPVTFDPPIRLQINYDPEELPENTSSAFIVYYDEELGWTQLEPPSGFVAEVGTAAAQLSHFTSFAVMAEPVSPLQPARFEIRNLDISPIEVMPGERVTISAWLFNIGGLSGEHTLKVNIKGLLETSQLIRLSPGQSQSITFTVTPGSPRSYWVEIDDLRGHFAVRATPTAPTPTAPVPAAEAGGYGWLIAIISAVAAIVALTLITARIRLQPGLAVEAGVYRWLIPTGSAVAAIAALAFTTARKRLQRAAVAKKPLKPVPGPISVRNLKITPNRVKPGSRVTIIAEVTNASPVKISYSLVLKIKGVVEAIKEITLDSGQSQKVAFTILKGKPGTYDVDLEGLEGSFTVEK